MRNFIFFWFLASVLLLALVGLAGVILTGPSVAMATWTYYGSDVVGYGAQNAVTAFETGGVPALKTFQKEALRDGRARGYLFDSALNEVEGQPASPRIREFASGLREGEAVRFDPDGLGLLAGVAVRGSGAKVYRVVISFVSRRAFSTPLNGIGWAARIGLILAAASLLCSWLALRLANPLSRLQQATRKFASGELSARVGANSFPRSPPEYGELARDFDDMANRIETLVNSQRQLLRDVSHELRTPLTRLGLAVNIARGAEGTTAAQALNRIDRESDRLNALIDRVIRLSRLETLSESPKSELIELSDFVDSLVSDANFEAEAHGRKVIMVRCQECHMHGDRELLREALENVIRNAIRYTPSATNVSVDAWRSGNSNYTIVVRDQGPGVPEAHLAGIFDPFHRAPQRAEYDPGGFGLGLAIAKRAVQLHNGAITARNCDSGLEVQINLPLLESCSGGLLKII